MQEAGAETVNAREGHEWVVANPGRDMSTMDIVWDGRGMTSPLVT